MTKRPLCLYIDDSLIELAKARNINLSDLFTSVLRNELEMPLELERKDFDLDKEIKNELLKYSKAKQKIEQLQKKKKELEDKKLKEEKEIEKRTIYKVDTDEGGT